MDRGRRGQEGGEGCRANSRPRKNDYYDSVEDRVNKTIGQRCTVTGDVLIAVCHRANRTICRARWSSKFDDRAA